MITARGMVWVRGGGFRMGSVGFYPEEQLVVEDEVADLLVDEHLVTNAEFRRFVKDTGWVTAAERPPSAADFLGADPEQLVPGSQVFTPTPGPVPLTVRFAAARSPTDADNFMHPEASSWVVRPGVDTRRTFER